MPVPGTRGRGLLDLHINRLNCSVEPLRLGAVVLLGEDRSSCGQLTENQFVALATEIYPRHFRGIKPSNSVWYARLLTRRHYSDACNRTYLNIRLRWLPDRRRFVSDGFTTSIWAGAIVEAREA